MLAEISESVSEIEPEWSTGKDSHGSPRQGGIIGPLHAELVRANIIQVGRPFAALRVARLAAAAVMGCMQMGPGCTPHLI